MQQTCNPLWLNFPSLKVGRLKQNNNKKNNNKNNDNNSTNTKRMVAWKSSTLVHKYPVFYLHYQPYFLNDFI